jgi:hypothetical protein
MAQDPQIQAELVLMNQDFSMAEEDGLQDLWLSSEERFIG